MMDIFTCPNCEKRHLISALELWEVYDEDGTETIFNCECDKRLIITSIITGWHFEVEIEE